MATPTETADKVRRAEDGDNNGDAGAQGTPALAVDTIQDGLIDVPVQLPAGGQEANILATPDQPRQAPLVQLFGGGAYQPAVYMATPVPTGGGPPTDVGASNATAPPAPTLPAAPRLRLPATGAITALAGARSATGTEQSPQKVFVRVVQEPNGTMAPPAAPLPAVPQRIMPISDAIGATDGTPAATASGQSPQPQYSDVALLQRWFRKARRAPRPNGNRNKLRRRACSESMLIFGDVSIKLEVVRRSCKKNVGITTPTVAIRGQLSLRSLGAGSATAATCRSSICACWTRRTARGASGTV